MTTSVRVNTATYSATHVATNMLRGLKRIIAGCGLDVTSFARDFAVLEQGAGVEQPGRPGPKDRDRFQTHGPIAL